MTAGALRALRESRLVPVVSIHRPHEADAIAQGLVDGGIGCAEITLRTPHGLAAIRRIAARGDLVVGAGTVLDEDSLRKAGDAGAAFSVSPGLDQRLVRAAEDRGLAVLPGIATASELQHARRLGVRHVKVFPAATLGGPAVIEALHQPFPEMSFMPSGGVTDGSAPLYLAHPAVFAVGVSWLVPTLRGDDLYQQVRDRARAAVALLGGPAGDG